MPQSLGGQLDIMTRGLVDIGYVSCQLGAGRLAPEAGITISDTDEGTEEAEQALSPLVGIDAVMV